MHYIQLANGFKIPAKQYISGILKAKQNPDKKFSHGLTTWAPCTGHEILHQFKDSIHKRINKHLPGKGRKYDEDYFRWMYHSARLLNNRCVFRISQLHPDLRKRFNNHPWLNKNL